MKTVFLLLCCCLPACLFAQTDVLGKWKTIDDSSGDPKSIIELTERNGIVYGKVVKIFTKPGEDPDPVCDKCAKDDNRFDKKVIGMEIITGMKKHGDSFSGGDILDPEVGKVYSCKLWTEGNSLKVRVYIGPFYRTQTWVKANP